MINQIKLQPESLAIVNAQLQVINNKSHIPFVIGEIPNGDYIVKIGLLNEYERLIEENKKLRGLYDELTIANGKRIESLERANKKLAEDNEILNKRIEILENDNRRLTEENKKLVEENKKLVEENKALNIKIEKLTEENKAFKEELKLVKNDLEILKNEVKGDKDILIVAEMINKATQMIAASIKPDLDPKHLRGVTLKHLLDEREWEDYSEEGKKIIKNISLKCDRDVIDAFKYFKDGRNEKAHPDIKNKTITELRESFMNFCNKQEKKYQEGYIRKAKKVLALIEEIGGTTPFINL